MSPRVSVIVAARDAAATLPETLASLDAQTFPDWEAILIDDGSADATGDIARSVGERVRVLRNEVAQGPAAARNRGVREARGELVAALDADDVYLPEHLASQIAAYDAATAAGRRVGAVCCDIEYLGPRGPTGERWSERVGLPAVVDLTTLLRENVVWTGALCSRAVFLELGGYDEDPELGVEDYDLWLRMAQAGYQIVVNREVLAYYRLGAAARSSQVERMARGGRLALEKALVRGGLTWEQRRVANRRRRAFTAVERRAHAAAEGKPLRRTLALARALPLMLLVALEHPGRWRRWLRQGPRSAGPARHSGA